MSSINCFVLTAPGTAPRRLESVRRQCESLNIQFEIVTGYLPAESPVDQHYSKWRNFLFNKRILAKAEVAAYLGHRRIWQKIVDAGIDRALIMEDDFKFVLPETAIWKLNAANELTGVWDVVKLFDFKKQEPKGRFVHKGVNFAIHERPNSGMVGYFVSRNFCKTMLASPHIFRPVDEELRHWFKHRIKVCSIVPNLVVDASAELGGSMIEGHRQTVKRRKNYLRSIWGNFITLYINLNCRIWCRKILQNQ